MLGASAGTDAGVLPAMAQTRSVADLPIQVAGRGIAAPKLGFRNEPGAAELGGGDDLVGDPAPVRSERPVIWAIVGGREVFLARAHDRGSAHRQPLCGGVGALVTVCPFASCLPGKQVHHGNQRGGSRRAVKFSILCTNNVHDPREIDAREREVEMAQSILISTTTAAKIIPYAASPGVCEFSCLTVVRRPPRNE